MVLVGFHASTARSQARSAPAATQRPSRTRGERARRPHSLARRTRLTRSPSRRNRRRDCRRRRHLARASVERPRRRSFGARRPLPLRTARAAHHRAAVLPPPQRCSRRTAARPHRPT
eukprot:1364173-Pleurochrysis_carterae.AAC.1